MIEVSLTVLLLLAAAAAGFFFRLWRQAEQQVAKAQEAGRETSEQLASLQTQTQEYEKQQQQLQAALTDERAGAKADSSRAEEKLRELTAQLAARETQLENERDNAKTQLKFMQEARAQMQADFNNLAQAILDEKSKKFSEATEKQLAPLLSPLQENLQSFRTRIEQMNTENTRERASLRTHIEQLQEKAVKISTDANNLAHALRGGRTIQGGWGEQVLKTLLENSGLKEGENYCSQETHNTEDGKRQRLDVIINLPDGKHLIIDSKVSLTAYTEYIAAEDDAAQQAAIRRHLRSVRSHVESLHEANYSALSALESPDFVLMFMPIEPAYILALQQDNALFGDAYTKKIVLVGPATLLPVLRTVANIWRIEKQQQHAQAIAEQGGKLYDKFCGFCDDIDKIGRSLAQTQKAYQSASNKLSAGSGNLLRQAEKLKDMGVATKKELPQKALEQALED